LSLLTELNLSQPFDDRADYFFIQELGYVGYSNSQSYFNTADYRKITLQDLRDAVPKRPTEERANMFEAMRVNMTRLTQNQKQEVVDILVKLGYARSGQMVNYLFLHETGEWTHTYNEEEFDRHHYPQVFLATLKSRLKTHNAKIQEDIKQGKELINMHDSYQTVDGRKVRIIATDLKSSSSVAAAITDSKGFEQLTSYSATGGLYINTKSAADLVKVKKKHKVTVVTNIYPDGTTSIHYSKEGADAKARGSKKRVAVLVTEQEVEEGHGL
jgi:hypothetical protein